MNQLQRHLRPPHLPGPILLAAQSKLLKLRRQDAELKREIQHTQQVMRISYEQARRFVLASRGLLK